MAKVRLWDLPFSYLVVSYNRALSGTRFRCPAGSTTGLFLAALMAQQILMAYQAPRESSALSPDRVNQLEERISVLESQVRVLLEVCGSGASANAAPAAEAHDETGAQGPARVFSEKSMPPELLPEIGKIGAEVGIVLNGSLNPYRLGSGKDISGFIDLPLLDRPAWLHGKVSYEISVGLSHVKSTFVTTSNVAQVANLTVLNALNPTGGTQNILDAVSGTGSAPFPVSSPTVTTMKLLQVVPFSLKYTTTVLDRFRLRPYAIAGFGTYVTIHEQSATNSGVRPDANLPASVVALIGQLFGGQAPFGGPLVAGQISQSPELEARGLPSGHGNIDLGWMTGGGIEFRVNRNTSLGFDGRWNRIAGAPGALTLFGVRMAVHF